mgnify:CR=1 FL=1
MLAGHDARATDLLKLLGHDLRWALVRSLARSDYRVQELADQVARPMNLVSYHLRLLREAGLVYERRSSADRRDVYCSLDLTRLARAYQAAGVALHPVLGGQVAPPPRRTPLRLLFLCTHNSARSQMAEGILRMRAGARPLTVMSAGTHPATIHPLAIAAAAELGVDIRGQQSKHLDSLRTHAFDVVVTVCDQAREECPVFGAKATRLHWSFPDPAAATGSEAERAAIFRSTAHGLARRIDYLLLQLDRDDAIDDASDDASGDTSVNVV